MTADCIRDLDDLVNDAWALATCVGTLDVLADRGLVVSGDDPGQRRAANGLALVIADAIRRAEELAAALDALERETGDRRSKGGAA